MTSRSGMCRVRVAGLFFAGAVLACQAFGQGGVVDRLNSQGIGTFSGKAQMLFMRYDWEHGGDDGDANAATLALTLDYRSPELNGVTVGVQVIESMRLFEGGSMDPDHGADWVMGNSDFGLFNEAFVDVRLGLVGLDNTVLSVGRKILNLDFAPSYAYRQKAQSYEGVFVTWDENEALSLTAGHIERMSSWFSWDRTDNRVLEYHFVDVEDLERANGVGYSTRGMDFVSLTLSGLPETSVTLYDFYGHDLYNTFGAKVRHQMALVEGLDTAVQGHYIGQRDVGRMDSDGAGDIDADLCDLSLSVSKGGLTVQLGVTSLAGRGQKDELHVPFRTNLTIDPEMLWYTRQFMGGSDSYYAMSTYSRGNTFVYALYVLTDHEAYVDGGAVDQEVNLMVSRKVTDNFTASALFGFGHRNNKAGGADINAEDCRLILAYRF